MPYHGPLHLFNLSITDSYSPIRHYHLWFCWFFFHNLSFIDIEKFTFFQLINFFIFIFCVYIWHAYYTHVMFSVRSQVFICHKLNIIIYITSIVIYLNPVHKAFFFNICRHFCSRLFLQVVQAVLPQGAPQR